MITFREMYFFLLFSAPLFLAQLTFTDGFSEVSANRINFFRGMFWGIVAGLVLFSLSLIIKVKVTAASLYSYGLLLYFLAPFFIALVPLFPHRLPVVSQVDFMDRDMVGVVFFKVQLCGFFTSYNIAMYLVHYRSSSLFLLFYLPFFYWVCIHVLGTWLWRTRRFTLHQNILSILLLLFMTFGLPAVFVIHELLKPFLTGTIWGFGMLFIFLVNYFLDYHGK